MKVSRNIWPALAAGLAICLIVGAGPALAKPVIPNAGKIVPADMCDPMFTKPKPGPKPCPARATLVRVDRTHRECLWCPPSYTGHVRLQGAWMCYRCKAKKTAGMVLVKGKDRHWCVRCKKGLSYHPRRRACVRPSMK
jgi:hypothetical protein